MSRKILVIRLGSLGDIILTSSAVINLKIAFPDSRVTYLCKEKYRSVVELIDGVDEIVTLPENISSFAYFKLLVELDKQDFDCVIDLHGNLRSWLARRTISANQTVTYPKRRYGRIVAVKRKLIPEDWPHTIDLYNEAVKEAGATAYSTRPVLRIPEEDQSDEVTKFVECNERYVVIAPGAAHPNKQWPLERFAETAVKLQKSEKIGIVWAATAIDEGKISPESGIDSDTFVKLTDYPLKKLLKLISGASLTIANDSGIAHVSSAVGTPVIAVFGPTHPSLGFAPRGMLDRVIEVDESCRPCSLHGKNPCYRDQRYCFDRIESDDVCAAATEILAATKLSSPAVFADRDGTIIIDKNFLKDPNDVEFEDGSAEAIDLLKKRGMKLVIISNQSGVARGYFDTKAVENVNGRLLELLASKDIEIDGVYYCPHHPQGNVSIYSIPCDCRKPGGGMVEEASYQLDIDLRKSYVVGDKIDDINLARVIGASAIMVRTGYGKKQQEAIAGNSFYSDVEVVDNLMHAAEKIVSRQKHD